MSGEQQIPRDPRHYKPAESDYEANLRYIEGQAAGYKKGWEDEIEDRKKAETRLSALKAEHVHVVRQNKELAAKLQDANHVGEHSELRWEEMRGLLFGLREGGDRIVATLENLCDAYQNQQAANHASQKQTTDILGDNVQAIGQLCEKVLASSRDQGKATNLLAQGLRQLTLSTDRLEAAQKHQAETLDERDEGIDSERRSVQNLEMEWILREMEGLSKAAAKV